MAQKNTTSLPTIGDVIRAWRKFCGLRSIELAEKAGVRSQYLSEIEHNRTANPREEFLKKLAVPLKITLRDIYARQMPPKDGAAVTTPSSQQGTIVQGSQKPSSVPMRGMANTAVEIEIPDVLFGTTGEEVDDMIASAGLSKEEYRQVDAAVKEMTRRLLLLIETEHKIQKEG